MGISMKRFKDFLIGIMTATIVFTSIGGNVVHSAVKSDVENVHRKVEHLIYSLKNNYLGLKNVGNWQAYIKEARKLNSKLPNGSSKKKYEDKILRAEHLVNAAARVNQVEKSMKDNKHTLGNIPQWEKYIVLAKEDIFKVDARLFENEKAKLDERVSSCEKIIESIKINNEKYTKEELSFGIKGFEVKGELIKPKKVPKDMKTVVIVGGSGPTDRDGEVGNVHPYKDIAEGLALKGIASFRYDKRTLSHREHVSDKDYFNFTIKEEYLDDYNEIMKYLASRGDINKENIYVIGHSQGGYIIPMLEKANSSAKGYVFMGASFSPIEDLMVEQYEYLFSLSPNYPEDKKEEIMKELKDGNRKIKALDENSEDALILGASTKYWLSFKGYDPGKEASAIDKSMLFLQGLNDYQVREKELNKYKESLEGKTNASYITYEGLIHTFTKGDMTPNAYGEKEKVSQRVIDDIASFCK
ncbi:serine aminopeptidase domain-containing protein [Clostridium cylindrosporum]|uniref:Lysophospholipase n=1 Tax=Clostridium cylindrosporum DSM 605 TaxID=1121307 RepID=A0A0J8DFC3_CLOCY|nr:alpha/beta hydrolase [Clostridium cylindrosporum]KMT22883.1 lysophospholipase [Clostridium cylindrosporum DSM 605]